MITLCFILLLFSVAGTLTITGATQALVINQQDRNIATKQYVTNSIPMNDSKAFLCVPLLGSCATPTPSNLTPTSTTGSTPTATATLAPMKTASPTKTPTPIKTPTPTKAARPTAIPTIVPTATAVTGVNQPVPASTSTPSQSITSTVTATTRTPVAVHTPMATSTVSTTSTTNTSTTKTASNGQNQNSSSDMLLPIGVAGFTVLAAIGILIMLQIRRRQDQKRDEISALAAQTSMSADPWIGQRDAGAMFGQPVMGTAFANNTMLQPDAIPPAMREAMQQPAYTYIAEMPIEDLSTLAQPSLLGHEGLPQQQTPLVESGIMSATPSSPYATVPAQEAVSSSSKLSPSTPPDMTLYMAADMQPLTMNLPENVISDLERKKTKTLPLQQEGLQDDPFLEAMMRQAQMGLFVLPDKETAENAPGKNTPQE